MIRVGILMAVLTLAIFAIALDEASRRWFANGGGEVDKVIFRGGILPFAAVLLAGMAT